MRLGVFWALAGSWRYFNHNDERVPPIELPLRRMLSIDQAEHKDGEVSDMLLI